MATINGLYIHVKDEEISRSVDGTTHPVETGIPLSDTVREKPFTLSLSGIIVDYGSVKASEVIRQLNQLRKSGSIIQYRGRNASTDMQIMSFSTGHPNTVAGGATFQMTLRQVRIAKSAYVSQEKTKSPQTKGSPAITVGSMCVFKGGNVYVSSDATKAAARRSRSTCECTIINTRSWSKHSYHLISTDGKMVYGWVDYADIEGAQAASTSGTTNGGTQQVAAGTGTAIYHTVQRGDTIWRLVTTNYKELQATVDAVMKANPSAFSVSGDATTLQVGKKILMGYRK